MAVRTVKRFRSGAGMARFAAGLLKKALDERPGRISVALPGGRTPLRLFQALAAANLPWERVAFFLSDERRVPASSSFSNFGSANKALFSKIAVPAENLHPAVSAKSLEKAIFKETAGTGRLDLVFLGLGRDGHTASLFPASPAWGSRRLALAVKAPPGIKPPGRLTLTPAAIEKARVAVLLAAGPDKKEVFTLAAGSAASVPAGRLRPRGRFYLLFAEKE